MDTAKQFETYRPQLFAIAYRMVGSAMEAEDLVQESYLRYRSVQTEEIRSPKAFLTTIVTRLCLNHLQSARVQREQYVGPWLPEPMLDGAEQTLSPTDQMARYESISLAFLTLLETLTPVERGVFLLREVFDYDYPDIAAIVEKSEPACRQLFRRAKEHLAQRRPRFRTTPARQRQLLDQFMHAVSAGEFDGLTKLLAEDVTMWADGGGKVRGAATLSALWQPGRGPICVGFATLSPSRLHG